MTRRTRRQKLAELMAQASDKAGAATLPIAEFHKNMSFHGVTNDR